MSSRGSKSLKKTKIRKTSSTENNMNNHNANGDDEETMTRTLRRSTRLQRLTRSRTNSIPTIKRIRTTTTATATTSEIPDNLEICLQRSLVDRITERINSEFKAISKATQIIASDDEDVIYINDSMTNDNVNNEALTISDESDIEEFPTHLLDNVYMDTSQPSTSYANSNTRPINNELMDELQEQQQPQRQQKNESHNLKKLADLQKETEDLLKTTAITIQEFSENKPKESVQKDDNNKGTGNVSKSSSFTKACPICLEPLFSQPTVSTICGHIYCEDCIKPVIQSSKRCPTCRKALTLKKIHPIYL